MLRLAKLPLLKRFSMNFEKMARDYYRSTQDYYAFNWYQFLALQGVTALSWLSNFALFWGFFKSFMALKTSLWQVMSSLLISSP
ncbi:MAG: hypothetical protein R2865_01660 [Deinococcales bacterium]